MICLVFIDALIILHFMSCIYRQTNYISVCNIFVAFRDRHMRCLVFIDTLIIFSVFIDRRKDGMEAGRNRNG